MGQPSPARPVRTLVVAALSVIAGLVAGSVVASWVPMRSISGVPLPLPWLFAILAGFSAALVVLVADRLFDLYRTQRRRLSGARMHRRLAALLSVVSLFPAAVAFTLTGVLLGELTDEFFVERMERSSSVARNLANAYADSVARQMGLTLLSVEREVSRGKLSGVSPEDSPIGYRRYLTGLAQIYEFSELTHVSADGHVVVRASVGGTPPQPLPPATLFDELRDVEGPSVRFNAVDPQTLTMFYALVPIGDGSDGYLIGYRRENPAIANELVAVRNLRDEVRALQRRIADLASVANIGFLLLSLVLLLGAAWIGLIVANAIVGPIRRLATAADRVSQGDLESRVEVRKRDGELGDLGHAFNEMTAQLSEQRDELIAAGEEAENRRRFVETMLGVIPAGVMSIGSDGVIGLANPSAAAILGEEPGGLLGKNVASVLPPVERLLDAAKANGRNARENLEWSVSGNLRSLIIEVSPETEHGPETAGFVVTIEDITELVTAQRTAAWADVARRIAHEIKNPLTPIQLSAERLRRRYAKGLEGRDKEVFDQCTATIIRHVGDIGRMVTEFSSFARMPEPIMAENDLREIAREALFPFAVAHPDITFVSHMPNEPVKVMGDGRLLVQALTNLIKNATEAIAEMPRREQGQVEIDVTEEGDRAHVQISDNGKGLPAKLRHRLTEPYMTTREKGTGLGLAIVRKAIEDHDGTFEIGDRPGRGAIASLYLPTLQSRAVRGETHPADPESDREAPILHGH